MKPFRVRNACVALALAGAATACGGSEARPGQGAAGAATSGAGRANSGGSDSAAAGSGQAGTFASGASGGAGGAGGSGAAAGASPSSGGVPGNAAGGPGTSGGATALGGQNAGGRAATGGRSGGMGGMPAGDAGAPAAGAGSDVIVTITNGGYWQDTEGNRIEAHGAGVIRVGSKWYWIGEDKSANSGNFKAVNCYASDDLATWEFRHAIITKQTSSDLNAADRIIERPKVVYNDTTKKFVMWLHWEGQNYATAEAGVFTSDTVDGDYTQVRHFRPNKNMSRDDTLFKDDDGKAYFLSASNENADLSLYELTDDYTDMKRQITTLWAGSYREAPAIMKANDRYFIVNSGATNWDPNQQKYATATAMDGPWGSLSNLGDGTGFDTQTAFIIPVQGTKTTTYIYAGDRWQDPDLKSSKYIWLPIKISGGNKLVIDWYASWQLNVTTGEVVTGGNTDFVPHTGWKLVQVDSEETKGEDGAATNAFDDSPSTFWHTQWQDAQPPPPHEIELDLGKSYALTAMQYTPRQDVDENGMVKDYEFYVSDSTSDWGAAVKTGTFGTSRTPTLVTFPAKTGRYIRFVGLSEINGKAYTSVAELNVKGTAP
jgi:F5/8 type C domain-containing protein/glycosyl hydrolase family 43